MILVNQNLSFIQHAQADPSWVGKAKYEIGGRISSLGTALLLLAEAVGRVCLSILAGLAYLISLGYWEKGADLSKEQWGKAQVASSMSWSCFLAVLSPQSLQDRLINGPLGGEVRENRIRIGSELIQRKLEKELRYAQNQMLTEEDGEDFQYLEGNLGVSGAEQVGGYHVGFCHYIGRRSTMEDEHLATAFDLNVNGKVYPVRLFGIFDGHGGPEAAKFLKERLKGKLEQTLLEMNRNGLTDEGIWNALKLTFVRLNQEFRGHGPSGSTATVALVLDGKLWTANAGDSRIVLDNGGEILQLTEDAEPSNPRYKKGIVNRGGDVWWRGGGMRVNGILAVPRAIGDHLLNGAISARPKITMIPLTRVRPGSHLVLACDGVYDVASSRQIGGAVRDHRDQRDQTPERIARNIVNSAYQALSTDNLSGMVVQLA